MAYLRLCSKCGIKLIERTKDIFSCPRGHGSWTIDQGIRDRPLVHPIPNGRAYEAGAMEFSGGSKSGKKHKKPPKATELGNVFERM